MTIARLFVLLWFLFAFTLSITGWFERYSAATLFGFGALASASGFTILHCLSTRFRGFTRAQGLRRLTRWQLLRLFGVLALVKTSEHVLPALFAVPTGILDIFFALSSPLVASRLVSDKDAPARGFFVWHVGGLGALALSSLLAILTSSPRFGLVKDGITSQAMTWFPMSIVPTFIGPFVLVCHLLAIVAARPHRTA